LTRLEEAELQQIRSVLAEAGGNRVRAATLLGLGRSTLYRKIEMYEGRGFDLDLT
jgi:transcriptional regulator with PAS, ATPase and Fis domain